MPIGCILGFIIAAAMINDDDGLNQEKGKTKFSTFLIVQNSIATLATLPLIILSREKPSTPPSHAASHKQEALDFKKELKKLISNRSYFLLTISFMTIDSICTAMGAIVASLTLPYHYSSIENSLCGGLFIVFGVIGSFILSVYLDKYPRYKLTIISISFLAVFANAAAMLTLPSDLKFLFFVNVALMGFATIPMTPIAFAFAVELTYPTPESMSNGMMILPNKIYGVLMGLLASAICEWSPLYAIGLFVVNALICGVSALFMK